MSLESLLSCALSCWCYSKLTERTELAALVGAKKHAWEEGVVDQHSGQRSVPLRAGIAIIKFRTGIRQNNKEREKGGESRESCP